jgi:modulator of FtsH protease HflK
VPEARGEAARIRTEAEGYRAAVVARAQGDAQRFTLLLDEYRKAPEVTRQRLYLETMQFVLGANRKVYAGDGNNVLYLPMDGQGAGTAGGPPTNLQRFPGAAAAMPSGQDSSRDLRRPERGAREEPRR